MQGAIDYSQDNAKASTENSASCRKKLKPFDDPNAVSNKSGLIRPCRLTPDVAAQVALHVTPPDVLALARTNKPIRRLLMSRSSAHIWRTVLSNETFLVRCPAGLSEPAYISLLFTSDCSKCGRSIPKHFRSLYTSLLVRLCSECRALSLMKRSDVQPKVIRALVRLSLDKKYCLRSEVKKVTRHISALSASGGGAALTVWKRKKRGELEALREDAVSMAVFIGGHERRQSEKPQPQQKPVQTPLSIARHAEIKRRLMALGWSKEDMTFRFGSQKDWMDILNMNTPVTERHWKKIHPRLIELLESNTKSRYLSGTGPGDKERARAENSERFDRHDEITRRLRRLGWRYKDMEFPQGEGREWWEIMNINTPVTDKHWKKICPRLVALLEVNRQGRPAREKARRQKARRSRLQVLWNLKKAEMASLNKITLQPSSLVEAVSEILRLVPIPELADALKWPVVKQLVESEIAYKEVETCFVHHKPEIETETLNWCASIKSTLADLLRKGFSVSDYSTGTQVLDIMAQDVKPNPFENLSEEMQLLLRADSMFCPSEGDSRVLYDQYLVSMRSFVGRSYEKKQDLLKPLDISKLEFSPSASSTARSILRSLGRPENMSFLELRLRNESYICGRCGDDQPKSWEEVIGHHIKQQQIWSYEELPLPWFSQRGIACHNLHDINFNSNKPFVKVLTPEERIDLEARRDDKKGDWLLLECCLCHLGRAPCEEMIRPHMLDHLRDVHEIEEPLLADPDVKLLKIHSNNFLVVEPGGKWNPYSFGPDDERLRPIKSERGSDCEDSEDENWVDVESESEGSSF